MTRKELIHTLKESGLCIDSAELLETITGNKWLMILAFRFLRMRFSPEILKNVLALPCSTKRKSELFSLAISYINVGGTYKTTGLARTILADKAIVDLASRFATSPSLLEIGVSDGSSAMGLLNNAQNFSDVTLTDRHNCFYSRSVFMGKKFYDGDRRFLGVKIMCFYLNAPTQTPTVSEMTAIETANPLLAERHGISHINQFDIFNTHLACPVDIIKCSNLLNTSYFSKQQILSAVQNLSQSLNNGGRLVISQNNECYAQNEALFILRKSGDIMILESEINGHPAASFFTKGTT